MTFILVEGSFMTGFGFVGPFEDRDDAVEYGASGDQNWEVVELDDPNEEDEAEVIPQESPDPGWMNP